ncbi:MAG: DUF1638 domain-containing protein [Acidimicrobiia bacterium]|nr:DUF1638 domain-containing protein [Acidimicrobiia bacterium]
MAPAVRPLRVIACGAIAPELRQAYAALGVDVVIEPLPAPLHNTPERITAAVLDRIAAHPHDRILVGYADCGTGGRLDSALAERGIERLPGAHCYEFFAGPDAFARIADAEPGTFYLTDFLLRNFDLLIWRGLGLDRHPELRDTYFGNYRRLVYLSQREDPKAVAAGEAAAQRLGLEYEHIHTGLGPLASALSVVPTPSGAT